MCQEKKAGKLNAESVKRFSLAKDVYVVTSDNKNGEAHESLIDQELSDPNKVEKSAEDDLNIETEMDRTKPNSHPGHGGLVGEARGQRHPRCCTTEHRTCNHISSLLIK